jgi:putative ABC transport system permease protein
MIQDLRYALRMLRHDLGFAIVAILSLALGIGANAAIFSLADFLLLPRLGVPNPSAIMVVQSQFRGESLGNITKYSYLSYPDFDDFRKESNSFSGLTAFQFLQLGFAPDKVGQPQMRFGALVSGNFFSVLDVPLDLGRGFRPDEDNVPGRNAVVVLGHDLWETGLGSDSAVIGKTIFLNGLTFTVVGVAPKTFSGPNNWLRSDLYVPLAMQPALAGESPQNELEARGNRAMMAMGRLKPGISVGKASAEAFVISQRLAQAFPKTNRTCSFVVMTYRQSQMILPVIQLGLFMSGLAVVVLLIACANVMNLMLSRASARSREIAVRLAIGAGRGRLVRQLLTESLVIAILGGALGLFLAQAGANLFSQLRVPTDVPIVVDIRLDFEVLLFALAISVTSVILFGLAPALQSTKLNLIPALKAGGASPDRRRRFLGRNALVIAQVAGSLVLLVIATQAYRGARIIISSPAGFRTDHILSARFNPSLARDSVEQTKEFYRRLEDQARTLAGVKSAALAQAMPIIPESWATRVIPEGVQLPNGTEALSVFSNIVSDGYFATLRVPLVEGREFQLTDREDTTRVVIVNEEFARKWYPHQSAIGKRLRLNGPDGPFAEIVGVAKQSKYVFPIESPMEYLYLPLAQNPVAAMTLLLETKGPSTGVTAPLRDLVRQLDSRQPIYGIRSIEEFFDVRVTQTFGLMMQAIGGLAVLGLAVALIGLYGLMTYSVSLRQREIGIRMAVGAGEAAVVKMVLKRGMTLAGSGVLIGLLLTLAAGKPLAAMVYAQGFYWPLVAVVTLALLAMAALGAYLPAQRASRVDPNIVLRQE